MSRIVMGKLAVGALVCALTVGTAGEAKARWGAAAAAGVAVVARRAAAEVRGQQWRFVG